MNRPTCAVVAAMLFVASCSGPGGREPVVSHPTRPHPSTSHPTQVPTTVIETPATVPANWETLRSWGRSEASYFGDYDGRRLLLRGTDPGDDDNLVTTVSGETIVRHTPPTPEWMTQDGWLTTRYAVFEDLELDKHLVRITIYDLTSDRKVAWPPAERLRVSAPELDVTDGQIVFITGQPDAGMCLRLLTIESGEVSTLLCEEPGVYLGDPAISKNGVTISLLVEPYNRQKRCKKLSFVPLRDGRRSARPMVIPTQSPCLGWSAVESGGAIGWDEADPTGMTVGFAQAFIRDRSGTVLALGTEIDTDSMVACGGAMFWEQVAGLSSNQILRWNESGGVSVVLDTAADRLATSLKCTSDRWLTTRVEDLTGSNERLTLLVLDTSTGP